METLGVLAGLGLGWSVVGWVFVAGGQLFPARRHWAIGRRPEFQVAVALVFVASALVLAWIVVLSGVPTPGQ